LTVEPPPVIVIAPGVISMTEPPTASVSDAPEV
jgi:hypothetical protein